MNLSILGEGWYNIYVAAFTVDVQHPKLWKYS